MQISTGGSGSIAYYGANKNGAYGVLFGFENGGSLGTGGVVRVVATGDPLMFFVNNTTEAMRITSGANVGLATGTPRHRLDVNGNAWIGATSVSALPDANVSNRFLIVGDSTSTGMLGEIVVCGNTPSANANVGLFGFANYNLGGSEKRIAAIIGATDGANNSGNMQLWTWNAGTASEKVRIDKNGNVGIGLNNPSEKLRVAGKVYVEDRLGFVTPGATDGAAELYREETPPSDPSKNIILRSFANKPQTLLTLLAPPGNINTSTPINLEATIALSRGDGDNKEFLDLYNNGYENPVSGPPNIQYGIRIQRRGTGQSAGKYRDFVFDQSDGAAEKLPLMILKASRSVGIGIEDRLSKLTVKGRASFQATGTVSVTNGTKTVAGTNTLFTQEVGLGDRVTISGQTRTVEAITSDTSLTVDSNFTVTASGQTMTVMTSLFRADDSSANVKVVVSDEGKVGIGTTTPGAKLDVQGDVILVNTGGKLGFYGTPPVVKPTVTGSKGGNAALASLLSVLSQLGLIVDNTSA